MHVTFLLTCYSPGTCMQDVIDCLVELWEQDDGYD